MDELAQCESSLCLGDALERVNPDTFHAREVDEEAIIGNSITGDTMPTTTDSDRKVLVASKLDGSNYIDNISATHNQSRVSVNAPIPYPADAIVVIVAGKDQLATQMGLKMLYSSLV